VATVSAEPVRLSSDALVERVRSLRGGSFDQLRAGLQAIANELELHRAGYDLGFEDGHTAGYDQAISDAIDNPDAVAARLLEIRPGAARRWADTGSGAGYDEDQGR
jgi:hypothetical protein